MTTVSEMINQLREEGYVTDFNLKASCLECDGSQISNHPDEFSIDRYFRFEGDSNPQEGSRPIRHNETVMIFQNRQ